MKTITMLDVETTGLDPVSNEIIEIGLVTFEAEATFKVLNTFNTKVKPVHPETGHPRAFEVNGYNSKDWEDAPSIGEVLIMINELEHIKGSTMASYNVSFDYGFIQAAYRDAGVVEPFHYLRLDMYSLAWARIPQGNLSRWNLKSVCEYLKVPPEPEIHRALNGAQAAYECYCKLMGEGYIVNEQTLLV